MKRLLVPLLLVPVAVSAGTFIDFNQGNPLLVTHPDNYAGTGGEYVVTVCLDPAALPDDVAGDQPTLEDPEQAIRNVVAEFNRLQGTAGNVVNAASAGVTGSRPDFESFALHEVGHCLGLDHTVIGPSEVFELGGCDENGATPAPSCSTSAARQLRYFANSFNGVNAAMNLNAGVDAERGSRDDIRGDDVNRNWFRIGVNNPFEVAPATVDRATHTTSLASLPIGHLFPEVATSFDPCGDPNSDTSTLRGQPATASVMFPVLCQNNVVRQTSWDDVTTLRIAQAGNNGSANNSDDYTVRLDYIGQASSCDIVIQFASFSGFAFCQVSGGLVGDNARITGATARFESSVDWFFNQSDTTGEGGPIGRIFYDGFE